MRDVDENNLSSIKYYREASPENVTERNPQTTAA